jgi:hypothetical protein
MGCSSAYNGLSVSGPSGEHAQPPGGTSGLSTAIFIYQLTYERTECTQTSDILLRQRLRRVCPPTKNGVSRLPHGLAPAIAGLCE